MATVSPDEMEREATREGRRLLNGLERAGYVTLGLGDATVDAARAAMQRFSEVPARLRDLRERAPNEVESGVESLERRGRTLSDELRQRLAHRGAVPYEERTVEELQKLATDSGIEGRSTMNKSELIDALRSQ